MRISALTKLAVLVLFASGPAAATGSVFTYRGYLGHGGACAPRLFDFQFRLVDASYGGSQIGDTLTSYGVEVADGHFKVELDFGDTVSTVADLWLAISWRPAGDGPFTPLQTTRAGPSFGSEEFVQSGGVDIAVSGYSVPSYADWNNDTLPDLIVGEGGGGFPGKVRVFQNVGTATEPVFDGYFYAQADGGDLTVASAGCLGAFPRVVYWDADARKDLLVGQSDGMVKLFLNTGTDVSPAFDEGQFLQVGPPGEKVDIDVGSRATSVVADFNSDGRKDLVIGAFDGYIRIYLNQGTDSEPDFRSELLAQSFGSPIHVDTLRTSVAVDDVTDDGKKDLVVGETEGWILLYENTGSDQNPEFQGYVELRSEGTPINLPGTRSRPSVCDFNGDGSIDLLVGSSDGTVRLYRHSSLFSDGFESADTTAWSVSVP